MAEKMYCSSNVLKMHRGDVKNLQDEKNREAKEYVNDVDLSKDNRIIKQSFDWNRDITEILEAHGIKERKNGVVMVSCCCRASREWLDKTDKSTQMAYWSKCIEYYENMGLRVVSAMIHKDEHSDHLELQGVPIVEVDGKFKCNGKQGMYGGGKGGLARNQTAFAEYAGKPFGLERGQERVGTKEVKKSLSDIEFQKKKLKEQVKEQRELLDVKKVKLSQLRATSELKQKKLTCLTTELKKQSRDGGKFNPRLKKKLKLQNQRTEELNEKLEKLNQELSSAETFQSDLKRNLKMSVKQLNDMPDEYLNNVNGSLLTEIV